MSGSPRSTSERPPRASERTLDASQLPLERAHSAHCGTPPSFGRSHRARWRIAVLIGVHVLAAAHIAHWQWRGRTLSPLEPSEAGETLTLGYVNAGFVLLALLLASTLVLGRFFCGWACHVVALQDACAALLARAGLEPKPVRSRALVWVPLLAAFEMFALPSVLQLVRGERIPSWTLALQTEDFWGRFPGPGMALLTLAVDGALVVWLLGAKGFCTYGCPYGALFGLADRFARGRIRVSDACEGCGHCTAVCTSNVRVHEEVARYRMVIDPGCMKCGDCVASCPKEALSFGFGGSRAQAVRAPRGAPPVRSPSDFSLPEEIALCAVFLLALYAFRNLYGGVPFLLALGLACIAALCAVLGARLLRLDELRFQHAQLRHAGRFTPSGMLALAACAALLAFTLHSAWIQFATRAGTSALAGAAGLPRGDARREALLASARADLERAAAHGLFADASLENKLGQLALERGALDEARARLERSSALEPAWTTPRLLLSDLHARAGRPELALEQLEAVLAHEPDEAGAARRYAQAIAAEPARAERLLARIERGERHALQAAAAVLRQLESIAPAIAAQPAPSALRARLAREN